MFFCVRIIFLAHDQLVLCQAIPIIFSCTAVWYPPFRMHISLIFPTQVIMFVVLKLIWLAYAYCRNTVLQDIYYPSLSLCCQEV